MKVELLIIILAPIICLMWYQYKARKQQELSDKLNNSVVNLNNKRGRK